MVTLIDGSSTVITGSGCGSSGSASVSPIVMSAMPGDGDDLARAGFGGVDAVQRLGDVELGRRARSVIVPSAWHQATGWPFLIVPLRTRQIARRPTYGEASRLVTCACSGWPSSYSGAGIVSTQRVHQRLRASSRDRSCASEAQPARAFV